MEVTCTLVGSTTFNNMYSQTQMIYKGLTFFVMAGFPFIALFLMM